MRRTVGACALLAALALGAPGCAAARPAGEPVVASLEPSAAAAGGGLAEACGQFMSLPSDGEMLALGALVVLVSPLLLVYAVVRTPLRVLSRLSRSRV